MRITLYILFAVGGILAVLALSMVFLDDEVAQLDPQSQEVELSTLKLEIGAAQTGKQSMAKPGPEADQPDANITSPLKIDIARVKPDGAAVFAGTATPNATIRIFEGKVLLGSTVSNAQGEWVIVLEKLLAVGQHLISVAMERQDGSTAFSDLSLAVEIYQDIETKPLVVLMPETSTEVPVLIQSPDDERLLTANKAGNDVASRSKDQQITTGSVFGATGSSGDGGSRITPANRLNSKSVSAVIAPTAIAWRDADSILISGVSQGGVRVTVNDANVPFGEALILEDGTWQIAGSLDLQKTKHHLEFLLMSDSNKTVAIYTLPLTRRDLAKGQNGSSLVVVNKGCVVAYCLSAVWRWY